MRLPRSVLDLVRGAGGAAVVFAVGCSSQPAPIHREPAARLVPAAQLAPPPPVVAALPPTAVSPPTAPSAVLVPAPTPPAPPTVTAPDSPGETAADRRNRRRAATALANIVGAAPPADPFSGTLGSEAIVPGTPGVGVVNTHANCGRG